MGRYEFTAGNWCELCGAFVHATYDHQCVPEEFKPEEIEVGEIKSPGFTINASSGAVTDLGLVRMAKTLERIEVLLEKIWMHL